MTEDETDKTRNDEALPESPPDSRQQPLFPGTEWSDSAANRASRPGRRGFSLNGGWKNIALTLGAFSIVLLAVVSWLLWFEMSKRFPNIPVGSYAGMIQGIFPSGDAGGEVFYLEHKPNSDKLLFVVIRPDWTPQLVTSATSGSESPDVEWLLPVTIAGPDAKLQFMGSQESVGEYGGKVLNLTNGTQGHWSLKQIDQEAAGTGQAASDLAMWLQMRAELEDVDQKIAREEVEVPRQRVEINKLTDFITEGSRLKSRAQQKLQEAKQELASVEQELKARREEAHELEEQFDLSHRVRGMGKLVSLARESLQREAHWVDLMSDSGPTEVPADLEAAVERGKRIIELKRELAEERDRIDGLEQRMQPE